MEKFTKGPWKWELNKGSKKVNLCGKGIEVLRFERCGMQGAAPTFTENHMGHTLQGVRAESLAVDIEGREHHSDWCQTIDHPDAHLIAAAPEMYAALKLISDISILDADKGLSSLVDELLVKARGESCGK